VISVNMAYGTLSIKCYTSKCSDSRARDAAVRSWGLVREEERGRKEAHAFHQAYVRGRTVSK
jgi:hypothetical protein